jgi:hypothetical protein
MSLLPRNQTYDSLPLHLISHMNFMLPRTMDVCLSVNEPIFMSLGSRDNGVE